jgi:hypothetical protein
VVCLTGLVRCIAASIDKYIAGRQEREWKEMKVTDKQGERFIYGGSRQEGCSEIKYSL